MVFYIVSVRHAFRRCCLRSLQLFSEVLGNEWGEADGRDVCDADRALPEVEDAEDGKAAAGNDDRDGLNGQDAQRRGFPHDVLLSAMSARLCAGADHHIAGMSRSAYADAVDEEWIGMKVPARRPRDGADVAGEACFHTEDDADYRRDEGKTEVNHSRDDRYWIEVSQRVRR